MRNTTYVTQEVNAGRMSLDQGMAYLDEVQTQETTRARREMIVGWVAVALVGVLLLFASMAWST